MNFMKTLVAASVAGAMMVGAVCAQEDSLRPREYGIQFGVLQPGQNNAITDVEGVLVGQVNVHDDKKGAHTGVTAILPHGGNLFKEKVPAGIFLANGFGKMTGYPQVKELGNIETPIVLVNTLNVAAGLDGIIDYTFSFKENGDCRSVNGVVGETNDGGINDIRARFLTSKDVLKAIQTAKSGPVEEGVVGAGSGTKAFGFKGGIGTSSRKLPASMCFSKPIDSLAAAGAILSDVWTETHMPVVDSLGDEFLEYVKTGMNVTLAEDGTVTVE